MMSVANRSAPDAVRRRRRPGVSTMMLILGLAFLYLPMFILVVYSFNASRLVTVWAGFSAKWYLELFQDEQLMGGMDQPAYRVLLRHHGRDAGDDIGLCAGPLR